MITFDEWQKIDLRVGGILEVKDHENADKLYILRVDVGDKKINLVAGLKQYYKKEELLGKKIIVIVNLEPVVLRGVKSEGMLLAADNGMEVSFVTLDKKISNGSKIR